MMLHVSWIRIAWGAALAAALLLAGWQALQLRLPFQFDYVEGMMLHGVNVAGSGASLYPPLPEKSGGLPILITAYPPLYYYVCAAGNAVFGGGFFFGRLLSLLSTISIAFAVAWMVYRRTRWPAAAVLAAAFFYLTLPARNWAVMMRVDAPEIALAVWGFCAAMFARRRAVSVYGAAALFLASFFIKHTMFAAPLAVMIAWWIEGRRRDTMVLAGTLAGTAGAVFGFYYWATGGAFYVYLFGIHNDAVRWSKWFGEILFIGRSIPVVLALALWFAADEARRWWPAWRATPHAPAPVALYLVTAFLSTFFGAKMASFWNHYLEFCAIAALAAGYGAFRLCERRSARSLLWGALALQSLLLLPLMKPWSPGQWFHGAGAVALAAGAAWCAHRAYRYTRWTALGCAAATVAAVLTFPGVWHWGLTLLAIWPSLAALVAISLLAEGDADLAALAALAATAGAAALLPVSVPVAWELLRGPRRHMGLFFIALTLATAHLLSPETNLFLSPYGLPIHWATLEHWLPNLALLILTALGAALFARPPLYLVAYAGATLLFAIACRDGRWWIAGGRALAMLAAGVGRAEGWQPGAYAPGPALAPGALRSGLQAPVAMLAQLVLLSPFGMLLGKRYDAAQLRHVHERVARAPDPVLAENVGLLSLARKPVLISDPYAYRLSPRYFSEDPLLGKIGRHELAMAVLGRDPTSRDFPPGDTDLIWSRRLVQALKLYYRKSQEYDAAGERFFIFTPNKLPPPKEYVCRRASRAPVVDGDLGDAAWRQAPWTGEFVDIEGAVKPRPRFRTRARLLWDQRYLYVAADMEEPHVWATLSEHDSIIYRDNDFELFLDPNGDTRDYFELEVNALNTAFDLLLPRPYRQGGKAVIPWNIAGLVKAVKVAGTLNDPRDTDRGWTVELALPWSALREHAGAAAPPAPGDRWRLNFSRVQWQHEVVDGRYRKVAGSREDNWVWTPQGVVDMHVPERWGYLRFTD